jgi:hypothetical protein
MGVGIALDCIQPIIARSGIPISEWVAGNPYSPGLHGKETLESGKVL